MAGMPRRFELRTDRLVLRTLDRRDITEFTRYRNLPEVARFQDWPLPYTRDHAHQLVDAVEELRRPTPGEWFQIAVEHAGILVGDLAVWLDGHAQLATIGYTLSPGHRGRGYATEGVSALVDWLFRRPGVHRITATLDPRNLASARVLERCGFEYVGTARSAALVRGEWSDDARFALLRTDRSAWRSRPTGPPRLVELVDIDADNVTAVGGLETSFSQRELVAPNLVSLAQALVPPVVRGERVRPWLRAVAADDELVGFVMLAEPYPGNPHPYLWRLLVDHRHQGRGIGRHVVLDIARRRRDEGATHLTVDWVPDVPSSPERFYRRLGFVPTGEVHGGEVRALLELSTVDVGG